LLDDWSLSTSQLLLQFPIDPETSNFVRRVKNVLFSKTNPVALKGELRLVAWSDDVLIENLDLDPVVVDTKEFKDVFSGNSVLSHSTPLTHR